MMDEFHRGFNEGMTKGAAITEQDKADAEDALNGLAIFGKWTFIKRGGNYGIKFADTPTNETVSNR